MPSVAIRGLAESLATMKPLNRPKMTALTSATQTARRIAVPSFSPGNQAPVRIMAAKMPVVLALAITDRSMPPIIKENIIPSARKPNSGI